MKVLVAGIGNIFLGDDGFGVEVANRMATMPQPDGVVVADYGIRGVHLAYELLGGYDALVLIDAVAIGEAPGTIAVIEPDVADLVASDDDIAPAMDAHSMNPAVVLGMLAGLGGDVGRVLIVGCQPDVLDEGIGLSAPVSAAIDQAITAVNEIVMELCGTEQEESHA